MLTETYPRSHGTQAVDPIPEMVCPEHCVHVERELAPCAAENVPIAQGEQVVDPVPIWYVPATHFLHVENPAPSP